MCFVGMYIAENRLRQQNHVMSHNNTPSSSEDPGFPWLYTAVDLITQCLMFMVLITTFGATILITTSSPAIKISPKALSKLSQQHQRMERMLARTDLKKSIKLVRDKGNLALLLSDAIFFDSGRAELKPAAHHILAQIGGALSEGSYQIRVEGYTDDRPIHTKLFPSNWELSAARAITVLRDLLDHGVPAARLAAAGYGEHHPRYPNNSATNRAANRRVEIVLVFNE
jgi:chemotaxis protein MotB